MKSTGNSMKQVSEQTGIPLQHLKIVKVLFPDGFKTNNGVDIKKVTDYYEANKDWVTEIANDSLDNLKKVVMSLKVQTEQLKLAEQRRELISVKDEKEFLSVLQASIQGILLSRLVDELQSKIETTPSEKRGTIGAEIYNEIVTAMHDLVSKHNG